MSTLLTINVTNGQENPNNFFFFQKPAAYAPMSTVYSNSLYSRSLGPSSHGVPSIAFNSNFEFYAVVQEASSGYESAIQQIDIAAPNNVPQNPDWTTMSLDKGMLGLSKPVNSPTVPVGNFCITTATFNLPPDYFNAGLGCNVNGGIVLSSFVVAKQQIDMACRPVLTFYVQFGTFSPGTVIDFTMCSARAAVCDFTKGDTTANVTFLPDGNWDVQMS